jgi:hypothetical protein
MNEATLWRYLRNGLRPLRVDLQRHEDIAGVGIPDVSYGARGVNGWIEDKYAKGWHKVRKYRPLEGAQAVTVRWRPGQREWLRRRGELGGRCWLFLRVGHENFLFSSRCLPREGAPTSFLECRSWCALHWETREDVWNELLDVLTLNRSN